MEVDPPLVYRRKSFEFQDFGKFKIVSRDFKTQYCNTYIARLAALRKHLIQKAKLKWAQHEIITLVELSERNESKNCILIGTLYKHQELKPSILRELSEELQLVTQPARTNYASSKDILYLEDEVLRIKLVGNHVNVKDVVTGVICAVLGRELENGAFSVIDWCLPGCCPKPSTCNQLPSRKGKILIMSGLDLVNNTESLSLSLLSEWITGMIGCKGNQEEVASIVCIIIAGNIIRGSVETHNHKGYFENKTYEESVFKKTAMATHKLDNFLCPIVQNCPVILMPGEFDPTCHTIPQQPLHPCILPQCARFKSFYGATNPWIGSINSCIVAGSSGQPITDIMKVADIANVSPLTWLERTLDWQHYAPTGPDTIPTYPCDEVDPFIMTECPDVYFAGNMDKYDTKLFTEHISTAEEGQMVRLICVPKFSKTQTVVLVDLENLKSWPVSFAID
ncbi:DNA polymerase delta subunit 2-like isoform X4 [Osmia bicornis bicornis]|uniref:DNA polymerase delta subunit 2-like isoform X4 n=1 Tax=Osmia bicornis bicornis TaxID=1437191 RepID=UPI001EAF5E55|nr:DNA polymerase delta subunit 2-like isoform X4 [Osmia bicornis bicornis]